MSANAIGILLIVGCMVYLVLQLYKIVLGCVVMVIATFAFLTLVYGVLWIFGLVAS